MISNPLDETHSDPNTTAEGEEVPLRTIAGAVGADTVAKMSKEGLTWATFVSKLGPLAFLQVMIFLLVVAMMISGWVADDRRGRQLERMQQQTSNAIEMQAKVDREAVAERVELRNALTANTIALRDTRDMVLDRLLGLKKDAETIKKDVKEVKEAPKDVFSNRAFRRPVPVVDKPETLPDPDPVCPLLPSP